MTVRQIKLPFNVNKAILAYGADLKAAFALAKGEKAFLVDGFGDLGDLDNFTKYEKAVKKYQKKLDIKPEIIACDLHPGYFSTRFAESYIQCHVSCVMCHVQHHEAHIASAIVDNGIKGGVIGVAFDGTGYGSDGNIWGGEFFIGGLKGFRRAAHLEYIPMPGGEKAIREPWRMAASYIYRAFGNKKLASRLVRNYTSSEVEKHNFGLARRVKILPSSNLRVLGTMIEKRINSPLTSSAGRLFDAVGSLLLSKDRVSKEAELPMELEKLSSGQTCEKYKFDIRPDGKNFIIGASMIIKEIVKDLSRKTDKAVISCKFHNTMADIILRASLSLSRKFKIKQVVLSGGVFQNKYLVRKAVEALRANHLKVYTHSRVPTSDSGIPLGQIAIANARARCA